jgi:hypothetical protein
VKSGEFREFCEALRGAEARGAAALLKLIRQSANEGQWRAAAWILERRYREHYLVGHVSMEPSGKDSGPTSPGSLATLAVEDKRSKSFDRLFEQLAAPRA